MNKQIYTERTKIKFDTLLIHIELLYFCIMQMCVFYFVLLVNNKVKRSDKTRRKNTNVLF